MNASPAHARITYQVDAQEACKQQYGSGVASSSFYKWSPDGIYCYGLSVSFPAGAGFTWIGTLDRQRIESYCKATYGDTAFAYVYPDWRWPTFAWACERTPTWL